MGGAGWGCCLKRVCQEQRGREEGERDHFFHIFRSSGMSHLLRQQAPVLLIRVSVAYVTQSRDFVTFSESQTLFFF